jgi:hypothetical protein
MGVSGLVSKIRHFGGVWQVASFSLPLSTSKMTFFGGPDRRRALPPAVIFPHFAVALMAG